MHSPLFSLDLITSVIAFIKFSLLGRMIIGAVSSRREALFDDSDTKAVLTNHAGSV